VIFTPFLAFFSEYCSKNMNNKIESELLLRYKYAINVTIIFQISTIFSIFNMIFALFFCKRNVIIFLSYLADEQIHKKARKVAGMAYIISLLLFSFFSLPFLSPF
jgi:hypothetical protein